ncbi:hypothetical protein CRG98_047171, partial [Punica granatum]
NGRGKGVVVAIDSSHHCHNLGRRRFCLSGSGRYWDRHRSGIEVRPPSTSLIRGKIEPQYWTGMAPILATTAQARSPMIPDVVSNLDYGSSGQNRRPPPPSSLTRCSPPSSSLSLSLSL